MTNPSIESMRLLWDKPHKRRIVDKMTALLAEQWPTMKRCKERTKWFSPSELIWVDETLSATAYIYVIVKPSEKGEAAVSIEIGWSRLKRLPQLSGRPSHFRSDNPSDWLHHDEVVIRLADLSGGEDFTRFTKFNLENILERKVSLLISHGLPYLKGLDTATALPQTP